MTSIQASGALAIGLFQQSCRSLAAGCGASDFDVARRSAQQHIAVTHGVEIA